jgi:hypothetical protein
VSLRGWHARPRWFSVTIVGAQQPDLSPSVPDRKAEVQVQVQVDDGGLALATKLSRLLDQQYLDPILGLLFPGAGDVAGGLLGLYAVFVAWRRRAPKVLLARMLLNLSLDLLGGLLPVVGDIWDFVFRANTRNLALLNARLREGEPRATPGDWLLITAAALLFLLALAAPLLLVGFTIRALGHWAH